MITLYLTSAICRFLQTVLIIFLSCLMKLTDLSCIDSSGLSKTFLLLLLQALFLVPVPPLAFFFLFPLRLLGSLDFLFGLKIIYLVGCRGFKLGFFALFLLMFFNRPFLYQLVALIALLVKVMARKDLYLGLSLGSCSFFNQSISTV